MNLKLNKYISPKNNIWQDLVARPTAKKEDVSQTVKQVFEEVKTNGDEAIFNCHMKTISGKGTGIEVISNANGITKLGILKEVSQLEDCAYAKKNQIR